jgi:hypothetical protein
MLKIINSQISAAEEKKQNKPKINREKIGGKQMGCI